VPRRVEGHRVGQARRQRRDLGLGGDLLAVRVEHGHPVALGEPPRQLAHDQVRERIHADHDPELRLVRPRRDVDFEVGLLSGGRVVRAIDRAADAAGEAKRGFAREASGVGRGERVPSLHAAFVRERRHGAEQLALGRQPQDADEAEFLAEQGGEAGLGLRGELARGEQLGADLAQVDLVAVEVKAQVLLHPQHVVDQRGALFVGVVGAGQPHQRGNGREEEGQAQIGQVLQPLAAGMERRSGAGVVHGVGPGLVRGVLGALADITHADIHNSSYFLPKRY